MPENIISILPQKNQSIHSLLFDFENISLFQKEDHVMKDNIYLSPFSEINSIIENFDDLDFLNKKFHELRKKEIDEHITEFEKILLYDIIEKRILEFPNPYLPKDHKRAKEISNRYLRLEREFDRKYKKRNLKHLFGTMFSWLG